MPLIQMSLVLLLPGEMHLCRSSSNVPRLPSLLKLRKKRHVLLTFGEVQPGTQNDCWACKSAPNMQHSCASSLWHVLRATTTCTFSTAQLLRLLPSSSALGLYLVPNLLRATPTCNFSYLISPDGSPPAASASLLFDPPEPQKHWKNTMFRDFSTFFAHLHLLSSESFSPPLLHRPKSRMFPSANSLQGQHRELYHLFWCNLE